MEKILIVKNKDSPQRLDKFLAEHYPTYSRAYLQKQIKSGAVLVNSEIKKPSYVLKENDKVKADILPPEHISLEPDPSIKLNVVYEDAEVIVVDKPAGLTVHPSATQKNGTLVNALLAHYPPLKNVGDPSLRPASPELRGGEQAQGKLSSKQVNLRPGIVHRLDKETSGLIIIAKNQKTFEFLKDQFKNKMVEKKYFALIVGCPEKTEGKIESMIARSKSDPTKQKISKSEGKTAITLYKVLKNYGQFCLIEATPKTGRMHQIRVHLAWLGNPIAGDKKYGKKQISIPGLSRQFLHAAELKITLPNGRQKTFLSPLPTELNQVIKRLILHQSSDTIKI